MTQKRNSGFTLLEVMVALAIVALSLTAITATVSQMIDSGNSLRQRTYASWIAQNRIAELRLAEQMPELGASNGEVEFASTDWLWRAVVAETGVEDLYRIDVSVSLAGQEGNIRTVTGFVGAASKGAPQASNGPWLNIPSGNSGNTGPTS